MDISEEHLDGAAGPEEMCEFDHGDEVATMRASGRRGAYISRLEGRVMRRNNAIWRYSIITPVDDQRPVLLSNNILDYFGLENLLQILINQCDLLVRA